MLIDYHMHLEQGDFTLGWLQRFVDQARAEGIDEIGFTEHSYRFIKAHGLLDNDWVTEHETADLDDYVSLVGEAKRLGLPVKLGIEMDYVPGKESEIRDFLSAYQWDYVLGSVHWLGDWGIDLDPETWSGRDVNDVYEEYYQTISRAAASGLFNVLSHLDLVKIFGHRASQDKSETIMRTLRVVAEHGLSIEVSSAGLRKPVGEIYPDPFILQEAFRMGITITLASDAHCPEHVGHAFPQLIQYAKSVGYRELATYTARRKNLVSF